MLILLFCIWPPSANDSWGSLIFLISSSNVLTLIFSAIILFNIFFCCSGFFKFKRVLACLSDIFSFNKALWISSGRASKRNLFATADWLFPIVLASVSWVIWSSSRIFWYVLASSIGFKFFLCKFSSKATLAASLSSKLLIIAGILVIPASADALYLLSPAIISYLLLTCLTIIGWITPCSLIDAANSFNALSSNTSRGWKRLGMISSKWRYTTSWPDCIQ